MSQNCSDLETIFAEIIAERARQDELHPWDNLEIRFSCPEDIELFKGELEELQEYNDLREKNGRAIVEELLREELCETAIETDPVKQENEAIQLAALAIRFVQWSRSKRSKEA